MNARRLARERNELVLATKHVAPGVIITPDNLPRIQGGPKKRGHRLMTLILSNLNRFTTVLLEDSFVSLQLNGH